MSEISKNRSGPRHNNCGCRCSDAWRCAKDQNLPTLTCHCECHRKTLSRPAEPVGRPAFDFSVVANRVPFKFQCHTANEKEHGLMHWNEPLNIICETITKYRNGTPGKSKRRFYVNERKSKMFRSLTELLNAYPILGQLAEATYPPNKEKEGIR